MAEWGSLWSLAIITIILTTRVLQIAAGHDYGHALDLSLRYFEAQRSGFLPSDQRVTWRGNSGLTDGHDQGIDLVGGYYDAGDNVKFGFPMAFTITMLSWSTLEYMDEIRAQGQLSFALDAIRWGTDYFIKAHPEPNVLWVEVGDGASDHRCWQRPEDMTTPRRAYSVNVDNHGSDVVAETAAAMAAASLVFINAGDSSYASILLAHARELFTFADKYRGNYDNSVSVVKPFYPSGGEGDKDELLWAAFWLYEATGDGFYLDFSGDNAQSLGGTTTQTDTFNWDMKFAGAQVLAAKMVLEDRAMSNTAALQAYKEKATFFMCAAMGQNLYQEELPRTSGGLFYDQFWDNMQTVTSVAFLLTVYGDHLAASGQMLSCPGSGSGPTQIHPQDLLNTGKRQVDYILGDNPKGISYMVGFGDNYPQHVHHRGASIVSIKEDSSFVGCDQGYTDWYNNPNPNPNVLVGALVGGPVDRNDGYVDSRSNYMGNEAATYNTAPLVGLLGRFA